MLSFTLSAGGSRQLSWPVLGPQWMTLSLCLENWFADQLLFFVVVVVVLFFPIIMV
jgi:hypothetical protein